MAQLIVYADGATSGSSFHLSSEWRSYSTQYFDKGPTVSSASFTYSLDQLPAGARNITIMAHATVGARFTPLSGIAPGYPKANGVTMTRVANSENSELYCAAIEFEDASSSTQVTYSFKATGNISYGATKSGSLSFDDVHQVVTYTEPNSEIEIRDENVYAGDPLHCTIIATADNAAYSHKAVAVCGDSEEVVVQIEPGVYEFEQPTSADWIYQFPESAASSATLLLYTLDADGNVLGVSQRHPFIVLCPDDILPSCGSISANGVNTYGSLYLQNISSVQISAAGWSGSGGSYIKHVALSGNGKTVSSDISSTARSSVVLDTGILKNSGAVVFSLTVTDSRNRSSVLDYVIDVQEYAPVSIKTTAQGRIDSGDNDVPDSAYAKVTYEYTPNIESEIDGVTVTNSPILTVVWNGVESTSFEDYVSGTQVLFAEHQLNKSTLYPIVLTLSDGITSATVMRIIGTASVFMRWDPKNSAIGFGCYPQQAKCVHIANDWSLIVDDILIGGESLKSILATLAKSNNL